LPEVDKKIVIFGAEVVSEDIIWEQFSKLEDKVSELISTCQTLEEEKADLISRLSETERILGERDTENKRLLEERTAIRSKIDNVLLKLEGVSSTSG